MKYDENGLQLDDFETIYDRLANGLKNIYGNLSLAQDTPDGQRVGIYTNILYDLQLLIENIHLAFDPDFSEGYQLDRLLKLIGTMRKPATKSTVDIQITASEPVTLPADYTVKDGAGNEWVVSRSTNLTAGVNNVSFLAKKWGAVEALAGTINKQVTIVTQVISLTNPLSAVAGQNEEDDVELRARRKKSISIASRGSVTGLTAKLLALNEVIDAVVIENDTDTYDTTLSLPAHTIWCLVDGGLHEDIIKTIAIDKHAGTGLKGTLSGTYTETVMRADGTTKDIIKTVRYDRPTAKPLYIRVKIEAVTGIVDNNLITQKLQTKKFNIGENLKVTSLYAYIYQAGANFIASSLEVSLNGTNWYDDDIVILANERLVIESVTYV